jgi:hypothetical protein
LSIKQNIHFIATIRQQIGLEETIAKEIEQKELTWYEHVQRMVEGRIPKIALKWMTKQKRAQARRKKNWMEGIRKAMNKRNLKHFETDICMYVCMCVCVHIYKHTHFVAIYIKIT